MPDPPPSGLPWVFGLRPRYHYEKWLRAVASIIVGRLDYLGQTQRTIEAQSGLGLEPSWYWYIARTKESFGHAVFLWDVEGLDWEAGTRGVCPFDTGGLWHGYIATVPHLANADDKRAFFHKNDHELSMWPNTVTNYLVGNYPTIADYVVGLSPRGGVPEILKSLPNTSLAWTWEGRLLRQHITGKVTLQRVFCTGEDKDYFLSWVGHSREYDLPTKKKMTTWIQQNASTCQISESPAYAAERYILSLLVAH